MRTSAPRVFGRALAAGALALAALLFGASTRGTSLRALSLVELVDGSELVVRGVAESVASQRDEAGRIVRRVTFVVERYLVGEGPRTITVQLLGGELGGAATLVPGEAVLEPGSRNLLFLERLPGAGAPLFRVRGMAQGRFAVTTDPESGIVLVSREIGALVEPGPRAGDGESDLARGESCYSTTLEHFESMVRAVAGPRRASSGG